MPPLGIPIVVAAGVGLVKKQAGQALLMLALTLGTKVLAAILKEAGKRTRDSLETAADQFEEKARHNAESTAAETGARRRLWLGTITAAERGAAVSLRELLTLIEQNADDVTVESAAEKAAGNLKELVARRGGRLRKPSKPEPIGAPAHPHRVRCHAPGNSRLRGNDGAATRWARKP